MTGRDNPAPIRLEPHPTDGRLALLRLDRPPVNAFDQRMWDLFAAVTACLHGDTLYRAVVITGGSRHFAAGADVKEMLGLDPAQFGTRNRVLQGAFHALATAPHAQGPVALRHAKRAVDAALDLAVEDGLALEADLITRCFGSEDGQRGLRSFVDQGPRQATFLGR